MKKEIVCLPRLLKSNKLGIISNKDFESAIHIDKFKIPGLSYLLMELMKINDINSLFDKAKDKNGLEFIDFILKSVGVEVEFDPAEIKNIPLEGGFIVTANHPYGGIEGLILLKLIATVRPDFKVLANFLLMNIPNLAEYFIAVNPFEDVKNGSSISGLKRMLEILKEGTPVGIFPAGEVSTFRPYLNKISDKPWHPVVSKLISKAKVPVLPVFFHGNNGLLFNILNFLHPKLRTAKLPSELFNKKGHVIKVRIGKPIPVQDYSQFNDNSTLLNYLRAKTYLLESEVEVKKFFSGDIFNILKQPKDVAKPANQQSIENEIESLRKDKLVLSEKGYEVFISGTNNIPSIIHEIGRLREKTFREIGEGTNKALDLDHFDLYYHHLFLWDSTTKNIVGAYRIGKGNFIFDHYGRQGFYLNTLFKIKKSFFPILKSSIELGRSFVVKEYQQKPFPLFLLWKGILLFLIKNPEFRYLIGPVSISNNFSKVSKNLIIDFFEKNYFDKELAEMVKPRHKFKVKLTKEDSEVLLRNQNFKTLDKLIAEIEPNNAKLPVLLRQYAQLNSKLIGFNIDPKFSDCLDGFVVLDINHVPLDTLEMLSRKPS